MAMKQMLYVGGIWMKFQKYEKDNDDRTDFMNFQKSYNNFLVSFNILFEKHLKNWDTAGEYGDGLGDQVGYTAYGIYKQTFRLLKQANFIETMYHKYLADKALADETGKEASMVDAFYYAVEKHYQGFMTFNAMQRMDDLHNTIMGNSNLAVLATGANTKEEDLLNDLTVGKSFASFKDDDALSLFLK
jgi:hypothetical protein|nr:MAG TPA: hypothetical protein [Bacteriophage sp.]